MTTKEIVDAILRFIEILTVCAWPFIFLFVLFLFRQQLKVLLPELLQRIKKAEIVGGKFEFSEVAVGALQDAIETGAEEFKDKPEELVSFVREQVKKLPEIQAATTSATTSPTLTGRSILWVDDKPTNNIYESSILKRLGASIIFTRSTQEALSFLGRDSFDLIISDVHRVENGHSNPRAGYDLLDTLRQNNQSISIIFYTGSVARMDKNKLNLAYGAADYPSELVNLAIRALQT